jgi:hypothetical protein
MHPLLFSSLVFLLSATLQAQVLGGVPGELTFINSRVELQGFPIAVGDINGDGFEDIVVGGPNNDPKVFVYFGDGKGYYSAGPVSPMECVCYPGFGALADFNGDGKLDLAITGSQQVFVMLGNGDGTFQPAVLYSVGDLAHIGATDVVVADLNADGHPDFVVSGSNGWYSFLNNGNGTFTLFQTSSTTRSDYYADVRTGDLNGDGIPDLVYVGSDGVQSFLGDGTGQLNLKQTIAVGQNAGSLALGDLNNDGNPDAVFRGSYLYRLFGKGDGTFGKLDPILENYSSPGQMQIADFNGDGLADLAVAGLDNFYIYYGVGGGELTKPEPYDVGALAGGLFSATLRASDRLDLILSDDYGFSILFSTPKGFEDSVNIPAPLNPTAIASADFNGDGIQDLVVAGGTEVQVFFGTGKASQPFTSGPTTALDGGVSIAVADFNADGKQDIAVATFDDLKGFALYLAFGNGDGTFGTPSLILSNSNTGIEAIAAGDVNGDGKPDILITQVGYEVGNGEGVNILFGNGDGTFQAPASLGTPGSGNIGLADFNNDGLPDVYAGDITGETAIVFLNQGGGKFAPATTWEDYGPGGLTACDINHDGNMDLVANGNATVTLLLGNGKGGFGSPIQEDIGHILEEAVAVACGSFTGTTYPEVVNLSEGYNLVQIMTNAGDGNLNPVQNLWGTGPGPVGMVVGKFHGQKDLDDIVVLDGGLADLNVLLNITKPK